MSQPSSSSSRKDLPDPAAKWGITPSTSPPSYTPPESSYTPAQQAEREKLRAKGINPDLKAEMDSKVFGKGEPVDGSKKGKSKGFWNMVAGTAGGGGWIK
ncbi:hypothetical protein M409DRAFT_21200 [Zasmidium cellare ATCC 36951]|uniref:Uncharacterized protein n=1 Tax=Zasmidium cellare ATCC 36951 TaxID=1080233 RepID=A0A6A6CQN6_ZASCE|nr:uncharacterized protein M409DRAFT_21200 [Zasmidium cellare ATCC 36951]KAF2168450.1 hypothetical protein M409DRAFT_21200 [Zasmidium cellare ATCC 36951]